MKEAIIKIKNLTKYYGKNLALDDLSLEINKGEMFGLVGPDGAGKSTLIKILCNLIKYTSGEVNILNYDLKKSGKILKNKLGYLSQRFSLYSDLTVDENIEFFAEIHNVKNYEKRRDELLEFTRLTESRGKLAENLSGGMKQKLALACTLIHKPEIIILDEPTTGVDPVSRREFWKILSELLKEGTTIILSTPYMDEAERCNKIALMNNGKIIVRDSPQKIKSLITLPVYEFVCEPSKKAYNLIKETNNFEVQLFGDRLNIILENDQDINKILEILNNNSIITLDYHQVSPTLENVFIYLIEKTNLANIKSSNAKVTEK